MKRMMNDAIETMVMNATDLMGAAKSLAEAIGDVETSKRLEKIIEQMIELEAYLSVLNS